MNVGRESKENMRLREELHTITKEENLFAAICLMTKVIDIEKLLGAENGDSFVKRADLFR